LSPYADNAATFLIQTLFGLYIAIVMLRFLFQLVRADFYNPVSQFVVRATNPPLKLLRRFIPGVAGIDLSAVVLMLALQLVELSLIFGLRGADPGILTLGVLSIAELINLTLNVFFFSILIQVILSWVLPGPQADDPSYPGFHWADR
jgi:YggT family protein